MSGDRRQHVIWIAILSWLITNVVLFADQGSLRIQKDRQLSQALTVARKRALAWGPEFQQVLVPYEAALDEAASGHYARVLLVAPPPRNVFESLAWHLLFPAAIEIVPAGSSSSSLRDLAAEHHAEAVIYAESPTQWRVLDARSRTER